jgi:GR25 family glycosyltransferase involved in LPS biosynthesis
MPAQLDLRACETLVVSLPDDLPRRENMLRLCERLDLSGRLLDAVKCQPGWIGCGLSHVKALRQADPSRPTLILEDDIATTEDYNSLISIPDDADALYLGCSLFAGIEMIDYIGFTGRWLAEETSEEGILRVYNMLSAHAIIYLTERYRRSAIEAIVDSVAVRGWAHDQGLARPRRRARWSRCGRAASNASCAWCAKTAGSNGSGSERAIAEPMSFTGRYINLDASTARRGAFEGQLERFGQAGRYSRFSAVDGRKVELGRSTMTPNEMGCLLSHYQCVLEAAEREGPTHVVEDDVIFAPGAVPILDQIVGQMEANWDLLFTDIIVPVHFDTLLTLVRGWRAAGLEGTAEPRQPLSIHYLDLAQSPFSGAASYVLSRRGAQKLARLMAAELDKGATMQADMILRHFVNLGELSAACTMPFLTSVDPDGIVSTTISDRTQHDASALALFLLRYHFFYGRSDERLRAMAAELGGPATAQEIDLLWPAIRYVFSEDYVNF